MRMSKVGFIPLVIVVSVSGSPPAAADHKCDPVSDEGWTVVPSHEITGESDGAPYREGSTWFVERATTILPLCNYFDAIGNYSLRSYSLAPLVTKERVAICRTTPEGQTLKIQPYSGPCPPKQN
jgi:hypothetical protein